MPQTLCPVLVGRNQELDTMLRELSAGSRGVVAVLGEAGIGKSRMLREVSAHALPGGQVVVTGRAVQSRRPVPYRRWLDALLSGCRQRGLPSDTELIPYRTALGRLLPEWHQPEPPATAESPLVLPEGVLRLLRAWGGETGVLFAIEDVHWADPETLAVVEYVADNARAEPLAVVLTARPVASPGAELMRELVDRRTAALIELAPLPTEDVATIARLSLDTSQLPAGLSDVLARADGVPFLVEELLAAAIDVGALARHGADWVVRSVATSLVPRSFADSVRHRLEGLQRADRAMIDLGALLGRLDPMLLASALSPAGGS